MTYSRSAEKLGLMNRDPVCGWREMEPEGQMSGLSREEGSGEGRSQWLQWSVWDGPFLQGLTCVGAWLCAGSLGGSVLMTVIPYVT